MRFGFDSRQPTKPHKRGKEYKQLKRAHLLNVWKVQKVMKATQANIETVRKAIETRKERSAWGKGVKAYALDILANFDAWRDICEEWRTIYGADSCKDCPELNERTALNGAKDWSAWAYGGSGLIYNEDIAERLCTKSELERTHGGRRLPNAQEHWLDVEARAAFQAWRMIVEAVRKLEA